MCDVYSSVSGTKGPTLHILANTLEWGTVHTLTVSVSTPFSPNNTQSEQFLVNKPPYGGDCSVSPITGKPVNLLFTQLP